MKDPNKIKELVLEKVDLAEMMLSYGVSFVFSPAHADEVQYRCPFHGRDNKPSARYYRNTQTCYCWYCKKSWDVISFIMEREALGYLQALRYIANKYKLDLSSIPDDPEFKEEEKDRPSETAIRMKCLHKALLRMRGHADFDKYNILCVCFLSLAFRADNGLDITETLGKLEEKVEKVKQCLT